MKKSLTNLLFISIGDICYNSTSYFEKCISDELNHYDIYVKHINIPKASDMAYAILKPYFNAGFDAVIDINSRLPALKYNGEYILNNFDCTKWHYILDHPLYHYDALESNIDNYYVLCLDNNHAKLIEESFPHIKKAYVIPLAAKINNNLTPIANRNIDVLFTGTYTDPVKTALLYSKTKDINNHPLLAALLDNPALSQEAAVKLLIKEHLVNENTSVIQYLHDNFLIDVFLQAIIREEIISRIIERKISVTIYGHSWDSFLDKCEILMPENAKYLDIRNEVTYEQLPALYSDAKISLNQMPWFKDGIHDRIPLALMNGCISLTDSSKYINNTLNIDKNYGLYTYSLEAIDKIPDIINNILNLIESNNEELITSINNGHSYALNNFSWKAWVDKWLDISKNIT